jgi:hypothetical protein
MLRVESFNVILVAAHREWEMQEGDASRDVHGYSPRMTALVVNFVVIFLLQRPHEMHYFTLDTRSADA